MFKHRWELAKALEEGREFKTPRGGKVFFEDGKFLYAYSGCSAVLMEHSWNEYDRMVEIIRWHEQLPILCKCSDGDGVGDDLSIDLVVEYNVSKPYPYTASSGTNWKCATPLTKEEVMGYIAK